MGLTETERAILNHLYRVRTWRSTLAIAKDNSVDIAWETADDCLNELLRYGFVQKRSVGVKELWKFNFDKWKILRGELTKWK
jgi:predicted transcriptional regulator